MGHPKIENNTPFAVETLYLIDENASPLLVPIVQATYALKADGIVICAEEQNAISLAGQLYGEPERSSYKYEPQIAFVKPATDVVLIGHAFAPHGGVAKALVRLRVGPLDKQVQVVGDRFWFRSLGMISMSAPEPFECIPLIYERAFGGWDRSLVPTRINMPSSRAIPVGTGFRSKHGKFEDGIRLPNLEDPRIPVRRIRELTDSRGFRLHFAGLAAPRQIRRHLRRAVDERDECRCSPKDFDRRFFNAASPGLVAPGYLKGG